MCIRDSAFFEGFDLPELLRATAWRTSALKAISSTSPPSWMSIARRTFPSRLELKRRAGSARDAPLAKVSFTTLLYDSPVQMIPSCDQTGVPGVEGFTHFNSSTASGSASLMSLRILLRVSPRQSPSSAIVFEMSSDADWPWLAPDFFMFSSWKFQICCICQTVEDSPVSLYLPGTNQQHLLSGKLPSKCGNPNAACDVPSPAAATEGTTNEHPH